MWMTAFGNVFEISMNCANNALFFRHCRNHHGDSSANHVINSAHSRKSTCLSYWIREVTWPTKHHLDDTPTGAVASKIKYENLGPCDKEGFLTSTKKISQQLEKCCFQIWECYRKMIYPLYMKQWKLQNLFYMTINIYMQRTWWWIMCVCSTYTYSYTYVA